MDRITGKEVPVSTVGGKVMAFIPYPLPPDPPIEWTDTLREQFHEALIALGRLDSVTTLLPDPNLFIYTYVRKEAVLSSQIEGTQSSLSDFLLHEQGHKLKVPIDDIREVSNYVAALSHGIDRLRNGFPLSLRLIREMHGELLKTGRGSQRTLGEFRRSQNWIGGSHPENARFVPPPSEYLMECLGAMEEFLHDKPARMPTLVKAAMVHVQFETIHPFLDGNGRIGRLLITLLLHAEGILQEPLLYLSLFFKQNKQEYYDHLQQVRTEGNWEIWLDFFARGVEITANQAVQVARHLSRLIEEDQQRIQSEFGFSTGSALRVHQVLSRELIAHISELTKQTGLSYPTVKKILGTMIKSGMVQEVTGRKRDKIYVYSEYYKILNEGTELD